MMNNRWRQIAKFLDNEERWEYEYSNTQKPLECPCCGSRLSTNSWNDERGCVETVEMCHCCGYENNWSYGKTMLSVGKNWYEEYTYNTSEEQVKRIQNEFQRQINLYCSNVKKTRRKIYT